MACLQNKSDRDGNLHATPAPRRISLQLLRRASEPRNDTTNTKLISNQRPARTEMTRVFRSKSNHGQIL